MLTSAEKEAYVANCKADAGNTGTTKIAGR